ncbi:DNA-binding protein [Janibacter limosus]|uniref:DNA-binding protein n=1 Tax=Janibacter limosus TaxID=53458 RepID=A0A4P6MW47_9MICO|nr:DNA-binding protein [Janibacter limosus]
MDPPRISAVPFAGNLYRRIVFMEGVVQVDVEGSMMGLISVPDAARQLGVSRMRIQQRIADGSLPAQRVGRQWVIDEADLRAVAHSAGPGRPLSPASAWALVAVAAGSGEGLSPSGKSRASARLGAFLEQAPQVADLDAFAARTKRLLGGRAERRLYRASPLDLPGLRDEPRLRLSGLSVPEARIAGDSVVEGYIHARDREALIRDHLLSPAKGARANVIMHVINGDGDVDHLVGSDLVVAADLAEHESPRERARAQELLADLAERHAS